MVLRLKLHSITPVNLQYSISGTWHVRWLTTSPTHSPVSTGWRSRSVFSLSWRQSSIVHCYRYLAADLRRLSDMPSRRRLRSSLTDQLDVRQSQHSTVGDRAFAVARAWLWNSLPHDIVASDTVTFPSWTLKHFLFRQSYPSILF